MTETKTAGAGKGIEALPTWINRAFTASGTDWLPTFPREPTSLQALVGLHFEARTTAEATFRDAAGEAYSVLLTAMAGDPVGTYTQRSRSYTQLARRSHLEMEATSPYPCP